MQEEYLLEMEHINKSFPGVKALDDVQLKVRKGRVHALMGENGAGKSTLMKILIGIHKPDCGTIRFKGTEVNFQKTQDALDMGISMIHQELSPIPHMTIAENIFLGREPCFGKTGWVKEKEMEEYTRKLLEELELDLNPKEKMVNLTIAKKQMIEIAKAVSYKSDIVIMDEPTSALTETEVEHLFKIIRRLKDSGIAIIYISHKMDEIFEICDDLTIFRDGTYVSTHETKDIDTKQLISLMVGRELDNMFPKIECEIGDVRLKVENLSSKGIFKNISFQARKGEIIGIAGLVGAGRTEVVETLFGIRPKSSGKIYIDNKEVQISSPADAIKNKIALLTEERRSTGIFPVLSVRDNTVIAHIDKYIRKNKLIDNKKIDKDCETYRESIKIKTPSLDQQIQNLSGGNQQKVLVARWLLTDPDILILDEPTRGIDVGAKAEIHTIITNLANEGKTIIMVSSELPEVIGMSDRIIVMHEGKITGELLRDEATQDNIMKYATGINK